MDQYIIDNMPDEAPIEAHMTLVVGDMGDQKIVIDLVEEDTGFVIFGSVVSSDADLKAPVTEGTTLLAFDPRLGLGEVLSLMFTLRHAELAGVSPEASDILGKFMGDEADQG